MRYFERHRFLRFDQRFENFDRIGSIQQTEHECSRLSCVRRLFAQTFGHIGMTALSGSLLTLNFQISRSIIYNRFGYSRGAFAIPNDLFQRSLSCTVKFQPPVVMRSFSAIGPTFLAEVFLELRQARM